MEARTYLNKKLHHTTDYPQIVNMLRVYEAYTAAHPERQTRLVIALDITKTNECLRALRQACPGELFDRGSFAFWKAGNGQYGCYLSEQTTKKLWRILHNFTPAICGYEIRRLERVEACKPSYIGGSETRRIWKVVGAETWSI